MLSPLHKAIILHIVLTGIFMYLKPEYFFNEEGNPKVFGTGRNNNCSPFPCYMVTTVISSISFLLWSIFPSVI